MYEPMRMPPREQWDMAYRIARQQMAGWAEVYRCVDQPRPVAVKRGEPAAHRAGVVVGSPVPQAEGHQQNGVTR